MIRRRDFAPLPAHGPFPSGVPLVVGVMVVTQPGRGPQVADRLGDRPDMQVVGGDQDSRIAAVLSSPDSRSLVTEVQELVREDAEILGVFPTFIGQEQG